MKTNTVETLVWVLVYGGLLVVGLGLSVRRSNSHLSWGLIGVGGVAAALGVLLIYLRSRMKNTP